MKVANYCWLLVPALLSAQLPEGVSMDTSDWIPYPLSSYEQMEGTALDMSWLLEAPSGQRGFLTVKGDRFVFEDGTVARFYGGNLFAEANFPDKKHAERLADIIATSGANVIRMHHLDVVKPWTDKVVQRSFFGGQMPETTRKIDAEMLDKFFYMFFCLKERGIYIFLSHISSRYVMKGDGFPGDEAGFDDVGQGFKVEGMYDPYLIRLQKEYLQAILTTRNPYTGVAMIHDPTLAMTEIINENSLFWIQPDGGFGINSAHYRTMLQKMFRTWLIDKYNNAETLEKNWTQKGKITFFEGESLESASIAIPHIYINDMDWPVSRQRKKDTYAFLYDIQDDYYQGMAGFLKGIGLKCPIAGSNHWSSDVADLHVNAKLDYVDRHTYFTHPIGEYNYIEGQGVQAIPMVRDKAGGNIGRIAERRVFGRPYTISEWHNPLPNPYRAEGTPLIAAFSCLHDWHPMHYAYWGDRATEMDTINSFEVMFDPTQMNLIPISTLMFHRQDFAEDTGGYFEIITPQQMLDPDRRLDRFPEVSLIGKYGLVFTDLGTVPSCNQPERLQTALDSEGVYKTVTGEIVWDTNQGLAELNSPCTQGLIGFLNKDTHETRHIRFRMKSDFGVVVLSSLTDENIVDSKRILVSTSGDARFTGVGMADDFSKVEKTGSFPFLMEPIEGTITVRSSEPIMVYRLTSGGKRDGTLKTVKTDFGYAFELTAGNRAMHYEIVKN